MTPDEQALQTLIELLGLTAQYEPTLVKFRLWDSRTKHHYWVGVQPDFYIPELGLYVELTGKSPGNLKRKLEQVGLMLTAGYPMLLIESLSWAQIISDPGHLYDLISAASPVPVPVPMLTEAAA